MNLSSGCGMLFDVYMFGGRIHIFVQYWSDLVYRYFSVSHFLFPNVKMVTWQWVLVLTVSKVVHSKRSMHEIFQKKTGSITLIVPKGLNS